MDGAPQTTQPHRASIAPGMWSRLDEMFVIVAVRPKLASDVKVKKSNDSLELIHLSSGRTLDIDEDELRIVKQFDGKKTIYEIIVADLGQERKFNIDIVLQLVDRVVRANMLESFPPSMFRQIETYLGKRALQLSRAAQPTDPNTPHQEPLSSYEQVPWRPRTPMLAERAQFLRSVELLKPLDLVTIGGLAEVAHEEAFPALTNIVTEGGSSDRFFIIKSGEANVLLVNEEGERKRVAKLGPGDCFGEAGLLEAATRNATVRTGPSRPVIALTFDAQAFERIISPSVAEFRGRTSITRKKLQLENISLFSQLSPDVLERIAHTIREVRYPEGAAIFTQGEVGDAMYIVAEGGVSIERDGVSVAVLGEEDFFGETALLFSQPRNATVRTTVDTILLSIERDAFQHFVREHLVSRRDMMPMILNRLHGGV